MRYWIKSPKIDESLKELLEEKTFPKKKFDNKNQQGNDCYLYGEPTIFWKDFAPKISKVESLYANQEFNENWDYIQSYVDSSFSW